MSEISDMIQRLCPDGVEYRKLGEVCSVVSAPKKIDKGDYQSSGMIPIVDQGKKLVIGYTNDCYATVPKGCYVIFGDHTREIKYVDFDFAQGADGVKILKANNHVDIRYLFHAMTNLTIPSRGYNRHWTIARDLEIPVPPLEVQRKIVEVLDNFSELTAELTAELEARKKQYEYYRDNLLNFSQIAPPNSVKWMKLGEICSPIDNIKWKMTSRSYQYIDLSSVDIQTHRIISTLEINCDSAPSRAQQIVRSNDVIFATTRPTQMRACLVPEEYDEQICSTGYCVLRADLSVLLPQFLFYSLTTDSFKEYLSNNLTLGNYPSISNSLLKKYLIPIPPLSEQERIVSILDRFEALTTDLTSGLPTEIKARQQQYEYYRDQLLTFKRAN